MDDWQATFLGLKQLPRELTAFEIEAFFTFTPAERVSPADALGVRVMRVLRYANNGTLD
jgi:hypothetical protein